MENMSKNSQLWRTWRIPWTEEPVGYGAWGLKESDTTERLSMSTNSKQIFYKKICLVSCL